jgi:hypothetical protein
MGTTPKRRFAHEKKGTLTVATPEERAALCDEAKCDDGESLAKCLQKRAGCEDASLRKCLQEIRKRVKRDEKDKVHTPPEVGEVYKIMHLLYKQKKHIEGDCPRGDSLVEPDEERVSRPGLYSSFTKADIPHTLYNAH